jgi:Na+/proline symporter
VFCTFAFFTNLIVMMSLTIAGTAVLNSLVADLSPELAAMLLASVIGGYTLIGGLGATFYVSYFNTALIFVLILMLVVEVFYNPFNNPENPFGSSESVFDFIACWKAPEEKMGNKGGSYLTFYSSGGLVFGIVNIVGNFGTVFCDQAYWQSSVAAKPLQGVWGFISGGLTWFAIPFTLATTMGLAYLGMSSAQGSPLLSDEDVMKGLAAPLVAQKLLGTTGEYAMLFLILMAVMSTGSAEVIAVASIVIYDVYQAYICPFKPDLKEGQCILCSKYLRKQKGDEDAELCDCKSTAKCEGCAADNIARAKSTSVVKPHYTCETHKEYKEYQEHLLNYKNWCIVLCTFFSVPLCLFCWAVDLNLAWTYYFTGILISSSVVPIAVSIMWARATSTGVIFGVIGGCVSGMTCWLTYASYYPGGLSMATFVKNTGEELPMLVGNIVAIGVGAVFCIVVTFLTRMRMTPEIEEAEWEKTRDIDNPLSPWVAKYKGELNLDDGENFHDRPPLDIVIRKFRAAKITAYVAAVCFTLLFVCIWPGCMLSIDILDLSGFNVWTTMSRGWAFVAAAFIIIVPMYQEVRAIFKQTAKNKADKLREGDHTYEGESQPLKSKDDLTSRLHSQMYLTPLHANKQDFIFQRLRNTLARVLAISKPAQ